MALSRKPTPLPEQEIEKLINQGGAVPVKQERTQPKPQATRTEAKRPGRKKKAPASAKIIPTQLRLEEDLLKRIDLVIEKRRVKASRHSWFLEAIFEKLEKEE